MIDSMPMRWFPRLDLAVAYLAVLVFILGYVVSVVAEIEFLYFNILVGIFVFVIALARIDLALAVVPLVLANPYQLSQTGTNLIVSEFILLIVFVAWLVRQLPFSDQYLFPRRMLILALVVIAAGMLSLVGARFVYPGFLQIIRLIEVMLFLFLVVVNSCRDESSIRRMVISILVGGLCASLVGIGQFYFRSESSGAASRVFGMLGGGYGALVASTLMIAIGFLLYDERYGIRVLALITIPCAGLALVLNQTRAWIAAFVVVLLFMLFRTVRHRVKLALIAIVFLCFLVLVVATNAFGLIETGLLQDAVAKAFRYQQVKAAGSNVDLSMLLRFIVWVHAAKFFIASPLFGIGIGNLRFSDHLTGHLTAPTQRAGYVDNQYIQVFTETGIIGGVAWIMYIGYAVATGHRSLGATEGSRLYSSAFGLYSSLLIFAIGSLFWVVTPHHEVFAMMVISIGLLVAIVQLRKCRK